MKEKETSVTIVGLNKEDRIFESCMSNDKNISIGIKFVKAGRSQIIGFSDTDYKLFQQLISTMSLEEIKRIRNENKTIK